MTCKNSLTILSDYNKISKHADVAELADAQDSGSCDRKVVQVQVLSSAPNEKETLRASFFMYRAR